MLMEVLRALGALLVVVLGAMLVGASGALLVEVLRALLVEALGAMLVGALGAMLVGAIICVRSLPSVTGLTLLAGVSRLCPANETAERR